MGVLKYGGTIIPFARYDGIRWANTWDPPTERSTLPTPSLRQIPREWLGGEKVPSTWRVWLPSGSTHETRVTGLQYSKTDCAENWGFSTDFPKALNICQYCCPDEVIGLALSTDLPMQTIRPADQSDLPFASLNRALTESEGSKSELNPLDSESRLRVPIRVERAWMINVR